MCIGSLSGGVQGWSKLMQSLSVKRGGLGYRP